MSPYNNERPAKPCAVTRGGRSHSSFFSGSPLLFFIRLGPLSRELITGSIKTGPTIFHLFIHRSFSAARRTRFLGQNPAGGHRGFSFRPLFWSYGPRPV